MSLVSTQCSSLSGTESPGLCQQGEAVQGLGIATVANVRALCPCARGFLLGTFHINGGVCVHTCVCVCMFTCMCVGSCGGQRTAFMSGFSPSTLKSGDQTQVASFARQGSIPAGTSCPSWFAFPGIKCFTH